MTKEVIDMAETNENASIAPDDETRIVVGVDGSECADRALQFAAHEAARWGALLHIVSSFEIPSTSGWVVAPIGPYEEAASAIVNEALTRAQDLEPSIVTKGESRCGSAPQVLMEACRGASVLVVGSRGRGEVKSLVLGSVSGHCVHNASCPVTVVH